MILLCPSPLHTYLDGCFLVFSSTLFIGRASLLVPETIPNPATLVLLPPYFGVLPPPGAFPRSTSDWLDRDVGLLLSH